MGSNLIVNPGVTLTINPSVLITINGTSQFNGTVIVNGTLTFSSGSSLIVAGTGTLTVGSTGTLDTSVASSVTINGTYNHAKDGDNLPAATWAATSNCNITGMTSAVPIGLSQTFGTFTWNCATQGAGFNSFSLTIKGNLFLQNSNGRAVGLNTVVL